MTNALDSSVSTTLVVGISNDVLEFDQLVTAAATLTMKEPSCL